MRGDILDLGQRLPAPKNEPQNFLNLLCASMITIELSQAQATRREHRLFPL